jgi:hypothetical protein
MKDQDYHRRIFKEVTGRPVRKLWKIYCAELAGKKAGTMVAAPPAQPTEKTDGDEEWETV